jgi:hypothetical protein
MIHSPLRTWLGYSILADPPGVAFTHRAQGRRDSDRVGYLSGSMAGSFAPSTEASVLLARHAAEYAGQPKKPPTVMRKS